MTAPTFTLTIPAATSGDKIAAVLRAVADDFHNYVDGLTPRESSIVVRIDGEPVAEWSVTQ